MKLIKNLDTEINLQEIMKYIKFVEDDYILLETEEDVTNYINIEHLFSTGSIDYKSRRRCYKYLSINFNILDDNTKEMIAKLCATSVYNIIYYYTNKGMSIEDAKFEYFNNRSIDIIEAAKCCYIYINSPKFVRTIIYYLPIEQAENFLDDIRYLKYKYQDAGHFGIKYGDKTEGLLDFIDCYGSYENSGLKNYTLNNGLTIDNFRKDLIDILYYGKYE